MIKEPRVTACLVILETLDQRVLLTFFLTEIKASTDVDIFAKHVQLILSFKFQGKGAGVQ